MPPIATLASLFISICAFTCPNAPPQVRTGPFADYVRNDYFVGDTALPGWPRGPCFA